MLTLRLDAVRGVSVFALMIWGWTTRQRVRRQGRFNCPSCGCERNHQDFESRCWFTLYRKYADDARDVLAQLAWSVAHRLAAEHLQAGDQLGIALRGTFLYGDIMVGSIAESGKVAVSKPAEKEALYAFLQPSPDRQIVQRDPPSPSPSPSPPPASGEVASVSSGVAASTAAAASSEVGERTVKIEPSQLAKVPETDGASGLNRGPARATQSPSRANAPETLNLDPELPRVASIPSPGPAPTRNGLKPDRSRPGNAKPRGLAEMKSRPSKQTRIQAFLDTFDNRVALAVRLQIKNDSWGFRGLAFTPDGSNLIATKIDSNVIRYAVDDGTVVRSFKHKAGSSQPELVACSHNGSHLLYGGRDEVYAYPIGSETPVDTPRMLFSAARRITQLIASSEYPFAMVGTNDGAILWQPLGTDGPTRSVSQLEGKPLAMSLPARAPHARATDGRRWIEFSLRDGSVKQQAETGVRHARLGVFSADGNRLVLANGSDIHLVDLEGDEATRSRQAMERESVCPSCFTLMVAVS